MADHDYAKATTWTELQIAHERFFQNYNHQSHAAHGHRPKGHRSPATVLGWVHGAWCDPADLDPIFRLRSTRVLNATGSLRFRHWRLYGERSLAGERAAVWVAGETLSIEYRAATLVQYRVTFESGGRQIREISEPTLFPHSHPSPQPFLIALDQTEWHPVRRLAPYRPRRTRDDVLRQERLFAPKEDIASTA